MSDTGREKNTAQGKVEPSSASTKKSQIPILVRQPGPSPISLNPTSPIERSLPQVRSGSTHISVMA